MIEQIKQSWAWANLDVAGKVFKNFLPQTIIITLIVVIAVTVILLKHLRGERK